MTYLLCRASQYLVMGFLDGLASIMQTFAVTKILSGSLIILLSQVSRIVL